MHTADRLAPSRGIRASHRPVALLLAAVLWLATIPAAVAAAADDPIDAAAVGAAINLSNNGAASAGQQVVSIGNQVLAVWHDRSYRPGNGAVVVVARSDDGGVTFEAPQIISVVSDAVQPSIAVAGDRVHVAWIQARVLTDPTTVSSDVWMATSHDRGRTWGPPQQISDDDTYDNAPQVLADGRDVHVGWRSWDGRLRVASSRDGGDTFATRVVASGLDGAGRFSMATALDKVHLAWGHRMAESTFAVFSARLDPLTGEVSTPEELSDASGRGHLGGVAAWGHGVHVSWVRARTAADGNPVQDLLVSSSNDIGSSFTDPVLVATAQEVNAADLVAREGMVMVAWSDRDESGRSVQAASSQDGGRSFSAPTQVASDSRPFFDLDLFATAATEPSATPTARLDYTVPERFGGDADGDGLIDYPQDPADLHPAGFPVDLDACASVGGDSGITTYRWTVAGQQRETTGCTLRHEFPGQGIHPVTLEVVTADGDASATTQDVTVEDLLIVSVGDSVASGEGNPDVHGSGYYWGPDARWQSERCNRSAFAGPAQAARRLEQADPRTSVTFLHLACSGAAILSPDGVLSDGGLLTPYEGIRKADPPLPPQVQELAVWGAGTDQGRDIDALLVSIGANDLKFSSVIKDCLEPSLLTEDCTTSAESERLAERKLELPGRYDQLAAALADVVPAERVFITEYFDPTRDETAAFNLRCVGGQELITDVEAAWAHDNVVVDLNQMVADAADRHGWNLVGGVIEPFRQHGYCAADPWVVQLGVSFDQQGGQDGAFHPTAVGHQVYGKAIAAGIGQALGRPSRPVGEPSADPDGPALEQVQLALAYRPDRADTLTIAPLAAADGVTAGPTLSITAPDQPVGDLRAAFGDAAVLTTWVGRKAIPGAAGGTNGLEVYHHRQAAAPPDLRLRAVEVVQAPAAPSAVVAGKEAVVRAEILNTMERSVFTEVTLTAPSPAGEVTQRQRVGLTPGSNLVHLHASPPLLPDEGLDAFSATVTVDPDDAVAEYDEGNNTVSSAALPVRTSRTHRVLYLPILDREGAGVSCRDVTAVAREAGGYAAAAFPVAQGASSHDASCGAGLPATGSGSGVDVLATLANLETVALMEGYDHVVGVVPSGWFTTAAGLPDLAGLGLYGGEGDSALPAMAALVAADAPTPVVAHELAHNFGLDHSDGRTVPGYRVDRHVARSGPDLLHLYASEDQWISEAAFRRLLLRLQLTPAQTPPEVESAATADAEQTAVDGWTSSLSAAVPTEPGSLVVSGRLAADGSPTAPAWYRSSQPAQSLPATSPVTLEYRGADGTMLYSVAVPTRGAGGVTTSAAVEDGVHHPEGPQGHAFSARVPMVTGTATLALLADGRVLLERPVTASSPQVTVTGPTPGSELASGVPSEITWTASDADGDDLRAAVAISPDGGATWQPLAADVAASSVGFTPSPELVGKDVLVRVVVSDGVNTTTAVSSGAFTVREGEGEGLLALQVRVEGQLGTHIETMQPDGSGRRTLIDPHATIAHWSPDGTRIAYGRERIDPVTGATIPDIAIADADGGNERFLTAQAGDTWTAMGYPGWSPDGDRLVVEGCRSGTGCGVFIVDAATGASERVGSTTIHTSGRYPAWSPLGDRIAFSTSATGNGDVYTMRLDGSDLRNLSANLPYSGSIERFPTWSPDGSRVSFHSGISGAANGLWSIRADGTDLHHVLPAWDAARQFAAALDRPAWSPDGRWIVFTANIDGPVGMREVYKIRPDGTDLQRLTHSDTLAEGFVTWGRTKAAEEVPPPPPPPADAGGPYEAEVGSAVRLDATGSAADGNGIGLFEWDIDGDAVFDDATGPQPWVTFPHEGQFPVTLRVTRTDGSQHTATATATVRNAAPAVDAGPAIQALPGVPIALDGAAYTDDDLHHSPTIDWGDGTPPVSAWGEGVTVPANGHFVVSSQSHTYADAGQYRVTVRVCDGDGACGSDTTTLEVTDQVQAVVMSSAPDTGTANGGTRVTVHGRLLGRASAVHFGSVEGTDLQVVSDHVITVVAPPLPPGEPVDVTVTTPSGRTAPTPAARFEPTNATPVARAADLVTNVATPVTGTVEAHDPDGDPLSYAPAGLPGNGSVEVGADGQLTYSPAPGFAGTDTFQVRVTDPHGASDVVTVTVRVGSRPPLARPDRVEPGDEATPIVIPFADLLRNDSDPDGEELAVAAVRAVDGVTSGTLEVGDSSVRYVPPAGGGDDEFRYTVVDTTGTTAVGEVHIARLSPGPEEPGDSPPTADAGADAAGQEGSPIALDGQVADDLGASVSWTVEAVSGGDGATCTLGDASAASTTVTCDDDGEFRAVLTADDGVNPPVADAVTVTVANIAPTAAVLSPVAGAELLRGTEVPLQVTFADPGGNDTHTCAVDWGDGSTGTGAVDQETGSCTAGHVYAEAGERTVTVMVTDDDGATDVRTVAVVVGEDGGRVTGGGHLSDAAGRRVDFGLSASATDGVGRGQLQLRVAADRFHGDTVRSLGVFEGSARWEGDGRWNGVPGHTYLVRVVDGAPDSLQVTVRDAAGATVYEGGGALQGGSLAIHR